MDSNIGLFIQLSGVSLIALLTLFLGRSLKVDALKHWSRAWIVLSLALVCLCFALSYHDYSRQLVGFYFLTEYIFGFLLIAGCRSLTDRGELTIRHGILALPFGISAFSLPYASGDINLVFSIHWLLLSGLYAVAFFELRTAKIGTFGSKLMLTALALLFTDYFHYCVVYTASRFAEFPLGYLAYNSLIDLALQIMLGFGMVIVLSESLISDVKAANEKLIQERERLDELAHKDPLTTALNRHAFHGYLNRHGGENLLVSGSVGFFDIDDLKAINDLHGHAVGDAAIRAVVGAIRKLIRAEDLIFRWGGDEFFVVVIGFDAEMAEKRMVRLETMLSGIRIEGVSQPLTISVSRAFEDFSDVAHLENAIESADAKMYRVKQARKRSAGNVPFPSTVFEQFASA